MTSIEITQNLRPLKFAHVVRPGDMRALERIVRTNSFLWGSRYNPILPLYKALPRHLRKEMSTEKASELFAGSIRFFEPDFLVLGDGIRPEDVGQCPCEIITIDDIVDNIAKEGRPGIGIGLLEVLAGYYEDEHKFVRRQPINYFLPSYSGRHQCFLRAVLGDFPVEVSNSSIEDIRSSYQCAAVPPGSGPILCAQRVGATGAFLLALSTFARFLLRQTAIVRTIS